MKITLELVPRTEQYICEQVAFVEQVMPNISAINFPDLLRFDIRSWDACRMIAHSQLDRIAHLRAIDFDMHRPFPLTDFLKENNIRKVLVIEGDKSQNMQHAMYPTSSVDFIRKLKKEAGDITIYAAFDPYRNNIRYELEYLWQKVEAGAVGFFSQPFFDLRLLEIYSEYLEGQDVYWGISPVTGERSKLYWETRNRAIFPKSFIPTLEWNVQFGQKVMDFCQKNNFNLYLMPVKVDLTDYLKKLFIR
ncbi:MAG: methylenetetrahydrofolate reductase [Bacteroidales bacterium]|jgi:methylenetetrahydrofolate reductase (NADPH)|nr:methylenetetrahydrofolate reductase [Bacteroidales bacterium]